VGRGLALPVCGTRFASGLGWREADIDVIDADLGLSEASAAQRSGFKELVPPAVAETPGWSLPGLDRGRKLLGSDSGGRPETVPLNEPSRVADLPELGQRVAKLLDGAEGPAQQVLFPRAGSLSRCG
jgi:hypothetical protein